MLTQNACFVRIWSTVGFSEFIQPYTYIQPHGKKNTFLGLGDPHISLKQHIMITTTGVIQIYC